MSVDYKESVILPKTSFEMGRNLMEEDKIILDFWKNLNVVQKKQSMATHKGKFVLHMGPPYANGQLHLGHYFNLILKDLVIRGQWNLGKFVEAKTGWDCHGLPIELKVEEIIKQSKEPVNSIMQIRNQCLEFAKKWLEIQKTSMASIGIFLNLGEYYTTFEKSAQKSVTSALLKFLMEGYIYRDKRPVMWSTVEKTTLAEAEITYKNHTSQSIFFVARLRKMPKMTNLENIFIALWTTTPWTLPGNLAYAYNKNIEYCLVKFGMFPCIVAKDCVETIKSKLENYLNIKIEDTKIEKTFKGDIFEGAFCNHPLFDMEVPMFHADYVNTTIGTGLVHTAPAHGEDDFYLCKKNNIQPMDYLDLDGNYIESTPSVGDVSISGLNIFRDQQKIIDLLNTKLLIQEPYQHDYPYSERGKQPIIFKLSDQWFIDIDKSSIRTHCLEAIKKVKWIPPEGEKRLSSMIELRPHWCISRQRIWGIPLPFFFHKKNGSILANEEVNKNIMHKIETEDYNFWYKDAYEVLPDNLKDEYEFSFDIVDVWFESGMTHNYVLKDSQADLYLEGSDQHRGWFQSSIMTGVFLNKVAPYKQVLTHGFLLDQRGHKMSKSLGNVITIEDCKTKYSNDIMRLWVIHSDYTKDVRIGFDILDKQIDVYKKLKNALKFLLGTTSEKILHRNPKEKFYGLDVSKLEMIDHWALSKIYTVQKQVDQDIENHQFKNAFLRIYDLWLKDISPFYMDIRKDILYCGEKSNGLRQEILKIMNIIRDFFLFYLSIFIPVTSEKAFLTMKKEGESVLNQYESIFLVDRNELLLNETFQKDDTLDIIENIRVLCENHINKPLEESRQASLINTNMSADLKITLKDSKEFTFVTDHLEIFKTTLMVHNIQCFHNDNLKTPWHVEVSRTEHKKCSRCRVFSMMDKDLCNRCFDVINNK